MVNVIPELLHLPAFFGLVSRVIRFIAAQGKTYIKTLQQDSWSAFQNICRCGITGVPALLANNNDG
ncbi:MAG: hypothetical protein Q7S53_05305 [bacterium]|nr:hypothetical protein [bacterium]